MLLFFIDKSVFCNATFLFVCDLEVKCTILMQVASQNGKCQALILKQYFNRNKIHIAFKVTTWNSKQLACFRK